MSYGPLIISINGYHVYPDQIEATILQNAFIGGVILSSSNYAANTTCAGYVQ